jgi:hypothetical protein
MSLLETSMAAWIKEDKLEMTMKIRLDCMPPCRTGSFGTDEMNVFKAGSRRPCFPGILDRIHSDNRDEAFDDYIDSLDYLIQVMERLKSLKSLLSWKCSSADRDNALAFIRSGGHL